MPSNSMATSDLLAPATPTPVRHAPVIETGARAGGKYCAGMVLLALPMLLALRDSYWLDVVTVTYLMAGLAGAWNIIGAGRDCRIATAAFGQQGGLESEGGWARFPGQHSHQGARGAGLSGQRSAARQDPMKSRERKPAKRLYGPTVQYADGTVVKGVLA